MPVHRFTKIDDTIGWMRQGFTAIGAVVTAVVPDWGLLIRKTIYMTSINFTGKKWIGAGLVCRAPGSYWVSDELAGFLTENHPDKFELADTNLASSADASTAEESPSE